MPELQNSLAQYLDEIGRIWIDRRKRKLEPNWNRNLMMIKGDDPFPEFKKDDQGMTKGEEWRWGGVINIVRVKVYAVFGMLLDIFLPDGKIEYTLELSPADMDDISEEDQKFEETARDKMKREIDKQLSERKADRQLHKKLLSLLYYGMCWSKYTIKAVKSKGFDKSSSLPENIRFLNPNEKRKFDRFNKVKKSKDVPGSDFRSLWSIFWDMEVDFDKLEEGQGVFERDVISLFQLKQKADKKGYIKKAIEKVIRDVEKSEHITDELSLKPGLREVANRKLVIDNREYWFRVPLALVTQFEKEELGYVEKGEEAPIDMSFQEEETGDEVYILAETANGEIIRYQRRDDEDLPYNMTVWEENLDEPDDPGSCPADNMVWVQRLYTGLIRGYVDNLRLAGDVIVAIQERFFQDPSQVDGGIHPGMKINLDDNAQRASDAIEQVVIQNVGESYLAGVGLTERLTDVVSMVPQLLHAGVTLPKNKPNTAFEADQVERGSSNYVGTGIRNIDEYDIEPMIWNNYEYNMMDPDFDPEAKGSFKPVAGGYTSYKNKVLAVKQITELLALVISNEILAGEAKPREYLNEIHRNLGFNPDRFLKSEEEKQKDMEQRIQLEQAQRGQALQDLTAQTQITTQGKLAEINAKTGGDIEKEQVKTEGDIQEEVVKGEIESGLQEEGFQQDMIKELATGGSKGE